MVSFLLAEENEAGRGPRSPFIAVLLSTHTDESRLPDPLKAPWDAIATPIEFKVVEVPEGLIALLPMDPFERFSLRNTAF
jgi:hypothetical protein